MAKKFIEKHKRKSILVALLFLFKGRAKFFVPLLLFIGGATTFVFTGDNFAKMLELAPVVSFIKSAGLTEWAAKFSPYYSRFSSEFLTERFAKAASYEKGKSFWEKFFQRMTSREPSSGTMGLLTGADILREDIKYGGAGHEGGPVKGVVGEEDKARGEEGGDAVNLADLLAGGIAGRMGAAGQGLYGDLMGENLADRHASGAYGGVNNYGPYMNKKLFNVQSGAANRDEGMYMAAMNDASKGVPAAGTPSRSKKRKMGKVSSFSWKKFGYKKKKANMNARINSHKRAMFQVAETFAMTGSAYTNSNAAYEYQAAYTGATYDGNDVNAEVIQTDAQPPAVPDTAFTEDLVGGAEEWQQVADDCAKANAEQGTRMSEIGDEIDSIWTHMGSPPKCCKHGAVRRWNSKVSRMVNLCHEFNSNAAVLSQKCQGADQKMECSTFSSMHINPCSKWKCWLSIIVAIVLIVAGILLAAFTAGLAAAIGIGLIIAGASMLIGSVIGGPMGQILTLVGVVIAGFVAGPAAMLAAGVASYIANQAVDVVDSETETRLPDENGEGSGLG